MGGCGGGRLLATHILWLESGTPVKSFNAQKSPPITKKLSHPNVNREILAYRKEKELDTTKKNANITLSKKRSQTRREFVNGPINIKLNIRHP